jgi:hypothetical protein
MKILMDLLELYPFHFGQRNEGEKIISKSDDLI